MRHVWGKVRASTRALQSKHRHFSECVDGGLLDGIVVGVGFGYCGGCVVVVVAVAAAAVVACTAFAELVAVGDDGWASFP